MCEFVEDTCVVVPFGVENCVVLCCVLVVWGVGVFGWQIDEFLGGPCMSAEVPLDSPEFLADFVYVLLCALKFLIQCMDCMGVGLQGVC